MNTTTSEPHGRREFLKSAAVAGGAVTVAAATGAAAGTDEPATVGAADAAPEPRGYRMTDHIERYYRLARF